ncbi:uncharacterized protein LOC107304118 [Oryza brachyantha]|uniref:Transmembrane protein n=1 Tax=Oryza brachyantha TaxID=4533 RepID=J3M091_ORYBR|nr:uncharacterized protein LOC107304118 [Oryza brachyantha]
MSCLSSPLAPKRQLKLTTAVTALLVVLFFALFVSSCEARRVRARGRVSSIKPSSHPTPYKDAASMKLHGSDPTNQLKKDLSSSMDGHMAAREDAKPEEGVTMASPGAVQTSIAVRVSKRLSHQQRREDTAFHLDYAGPRTHPPSHN